MAYWWAQAFKGHRMALCPGFPQYRQRPRASRSCFPLAVRHRRPTCMGSVSGTEGEEVRAVQGSPNVQEGWAVHRWWRRRRRPSTRKASSTRESKSRGSLGVIISSWISLSSPSRNLARKGASFQSQAAASVPNWMEKYVTEPPFWFNRTSWEAASSPWADRQTA